MRITRVLDTVYETKVGWNPSTGAIKPVHIANGLFRELTHRFYDNLFGTYPAAQPLFGRRSRQDQEKMLRDMLVAVIGVKQGLPRPDNLAALDPWTEKIIDDAVPGPPGPPDGARYAVDGEPHRARGKRT